MKPTITREPLGVVPGFARFEITKRRRYAYVGVDLHPTNYNLTDAAKDDLRVQLAMLVGMSIGAHPPARRHPLSFHAGNTYSSVSGISVEYADAALDLFRTIVCDGDNLVRCREAS